ncbi:MAG: primosomal protein N' [Bacillota bacterium]
MPGEDKAYARVVIDHNSFKLNRYYDYLVPAGFRPSIDVGSRVLVPFGSRLLEGYVVELPQKPETRKELKEINQLIDAKPLLSREGIELAKWMSDAYLCSMAAALRCQIPPSPRGRKQVAWRWKAKDDAATRGLLEYLKELDALAGDLAHYLQQKKSVTEETLKRRFAGNAWQPLVNLLLAHGLVERAMQVGQARLFAKPLKATLTCDGQVASAAADEMRKKAPRLADALSVLAEMTSCWLEDLAEAGIGRRQVDALVEKGWIKLEEAVPLGILPIDTEAACAREIVLNESQEAALTQIIKQLNKKEPGTVLLHGVTGSGKTEVYLEAIQRVLDAGRQAIVLVPEIALTPQTLARFQARFPGLVGILHSGMTGRERLNSWLKIKNGETRVVVGTRSAVFAPCNNLGLIVLDEEHETSYKQDVNPRYHAREVAQERAKRQQALVILASASPSLETYWNWENKKYQLAVIHNRPQDRTMPAVRVVDLREELKAGNHSVFSRQLQAAIAQRLLQGQQVILFLNRRGYAGFVSCRECGFVLKCSHCDVSLVAHEAGSQLCCHYCGYQKAMPPRCPSCRGERIRAFGLGTERVENEALTLFPTARVLRLDTDTTKTRGAHQTIVQQFAQHEADILVGTQMVAKGLDFPLVTLVGVISADTTLNLPDFRAAERTFQLLLQVSGRSGRGSREGEVIIQTFSPHHPSIQAAACHDYLGFYRHEAEQRRKYLYPPFTSIIRLLITGLKEEQVITAAQSMNRLLVGAGESRRDLGIDILGPSPATITRLKNYYRWQIIVKGSNLDAIREVTKKAVTDFWSDPAATRISVGVEVEPYGMF